MLETEIRLREVICLLWRESAEKKNTEAKEATLSRKAVKGKGFMQPNICDISSLHTPSPIPLALGVPNAKVGLTKTAKSKGISWLAQVLCMAMWSLNVLEIVTFLGI